MEHLVQLIKHKAGVTDDQAKLAAEAVLDHFKLKFPSVLHAEIDRVADGGDFGDAAKARFEDVRDKLEEMAKHAGDKAGDLANEIRHKINELFSKK